MRLILKSTLIFLVFGGLLSCLVQYLRLGNWYWSFYGVLAWWLPNGVAGLLIRHQTAKRVNNSQMLAIFYRTELFRWGTMLLALVLAMKYGSARLDLLLGYVAAILLWLFLRCLTIGTRD